MNARLVVFLATVWLFAAGAIPTELPKSQSDSIPFSLEVATALVTLPEHRQTPTATHTYRITLRIGNRAEVPIHCDNIIVLVDPSPNPQYGFAQMSGDEVMIGVSFAGDDDIALALPALPPHASRTIVLRSDGVLDAMLSAQNEKSFGILVGFLVNDMGASLEGMLPSWSQLAEESARTTIVPMSYAGTIEIIDNADPESANLP